MMISKLPCNQSRNKRCEAFFGGLSNKHPRAFTKAFKGKGCERCGKCGKSRLGRQGWVEAGGVRQLRRHESLGDKGCSSRCVRALHVPVLVSGMFGYVARHFDSLADAGPTSALSERPDVSYASVRPLSSAHQFTRLFHGLPGQFVHASVLLNEALK